MEAVRPPTLTPQKKNSVNKKMSEISRKFWDSMWSATAAIGEVLKSEMLDVEDYMITGEPSGQKRLRLSIGGEEIRNCMLSLSWYKMETGRYEVNVYVS